MNPNSIATLIRTHGTPVPSGGYELLVSWKDTANIPQGSVIQEYQDFARQCTVFVLHQRPMVIDIKANVVDVEDEITGQRTAVSHNSNVTVTEVPQSSPQ